MTPRESIHHMSLTVMIPAPLVVIAPFERQADRQVGRQAGRQFKDSTYNDSDLNFGLSTFGHASVVVICSS
jgi:hypothetical protein